MQGIFLKFAAKSVATIPCTKWRKTTTFAPSISVNGGSYIILCSSQLRNSVRRCFHYVKLNAIENNFNS